MATYTAHAFRPHLMTDQDMQALAQMVWEPFDWYAPGSSEQDIFDLLRGNGASRVDVALRDGQPCGFLATEISVVDGYTICYHIGVSILEQDRRQGLYKMLTDRALAGQDVDYMVARTQNPAVYETMQRYALQAEIYPSPGIEQPRHITAIARALCTLDSFEPRRLIVRNAHGFVREGRDYMKAKDPTINWFFGQLLGRDDGFMVVARVK